MRPRPGLGRRRTETFRIRIAFSIESAKTRSLVHALGNRSPGRKSSLKADHRRDAGRWRSDPADPNWEPDDGADLAEPLQTKKRRPEAAGFNHEQNLIFLLLPPSFIFSSCPLPFPHGSASTDSLAPARLCMPVCRSKRGNTRHPAHPPQPTAPPPQPPPRPAPSTMIHHPFPPFPDII